MPSPTVERARQLRREMSNTERRVWYWLRRKQLGGHRFRRRLPVGPYFVDFVCLKARLAIEVDGAGHDDADYDRRKTEYLEARGFRVMRISAAGTDHNLSDVMHWIWEELETPSSPP